MPVYIYCIFFIHSSVDGHLGLFYGLAIVHSATINMGVQVPLLCVDLHPFRYKLRSGIAGLYGTSVFTFFAEPPY
jgi:hypothetical protein